MRGTVPRPPDRGRQARFIPAHAGNSRCRRRMPAAPAVHPRACGEQAERIIIRGDIGGSSPRMRGTGILPLFALRAIRFIPAHAGNSSRWRASCWQRPVHPRACGEQIGHGQRLNAGAGSSPRMRGTGRGRISPVARGRFIPAHAGNRASIPVPECRPPVHPRACGEQMRKKEAAQFSAGSSPRMRGTG